MPLLPPAWPYPCQFSEIGIIPIPNTRRRHSPPPASHAPHRRPGQERQVQAAVDACRAAARQVAGWRPEILVLSSPHTVLYADYFHISPCAGASGSMAAFGAPQTRLGVKYDAALRQELIQQARRRAYRPGRRGSETRPWTTALSCPSISSKRPEYIVPSRVPDCQVFLLYITISFGNVFPNRRPNRATGQSSSPAAISPISCGMAAPTAIPGGAGI